MPEYYLEMNNISKNFGAVSALSDVELKCRKGEIHVLIGENGAGKSTILKILAGIYQQDNGTIKIEGETVNLKKPQDSQKMGIAMVFQELTLVSELTVAENIFLGKEIRKNGLIQKREQKELLQACMEQYGISIDPDAIVDRLSVAEKQLVEIVKVLMRNPDLIILDEPTSSLAKKEVENLFEIMRKLKAEGKTLIYISHRMEEIFAIGDRVTVFKDGSFIGTENIEDINVDELICMMVGRTLENIFPEKNHKVEDEVIFEVENLEIAGNGKKVDFKVKKGEILGIAGLQGHGQTELLNAISGLEHVSSGTVTIHGEKRKIKSSKHAIKEGIALIPSERKKEGLVLNASIRNNIALASLSDRTTLGIINDQKEKEIANEYGKKLNIKMTGIEQEVGQLSGGNQQKVVLAKELAIKPKVLLFNEPTRGIDVEAKREFYHIMRELAGQGVAVIMYSNDLMEVIGMSDRVMVMYENGITGILEEGEIAEVNIMRYAMGITEEQEVETC